MTEVQMIDAEIEAIKQHDALPPEEKKKRIAHLQDIRRQMAVVEYGEIKPEELK